MEQVGSVVSRICTADSCFCYLNMITVKQHENIDTKEYSSKQRLLQLYEESKKNLKQAYKELQGAPTDAGEVNKQDMRGQQKHQSANINPAAAVNESTVKESPTRAAFSSPPIPPRSSYSSSSSSVVSGPTRSQTPVPTSTRTSTNTFFPSLYFAAFMLVFAVLVVKLGPRLFSSVQTPSNYTKK